MDFVNALWVEKYRPKKLDELILRSDYKKIFSEFINKKEIPNLLLVGTPGSGKTTLGRILSSENGIISFPQNSVLFLNGSSKSCRGISFVDDVIEPFLKTQSISKDKCKIVFIDEADYLTDSSFSSLRGIIEKYNNNGRFILTANYLSKIPQAIISRCQMFKFDKLSDNFIFDYCVNILHSENVKFKEKNINFIIKEIYPDVRKIVNTIQKNVINSELVINADTAITNEKKIIRYVIDIISNRKQKNKINRMISEIVNIIDNPDINFRNIYSSLFFDQNNVPIPVKILVNKYANNHNSCLLPPMNFVAMLFDIIQLQCLQ